MGYILKVGFSMTFGEAAGLALGVLSIVAGEWVSKMPKPLRNALTILGFILLGYSGIIGLQDITGMPIQTGPLLVIIAGLIIMAGGVLWHIKAKPLSDLTAAQFEPMAPRGTMAEENTAASRPLRSLSNTQLRDATIDFAAKMRTFETNAEPQFHMPPAGLSKDQMQAQWNAETNRMEEGRRQKQLEFSNNYLGTARELRDEIILRLKIIGILSPYVELTPIEAIGPRVLDIGNLVGPYPVMSAANYLEKLARRLPLP